MFYLRHYHGMWFVGSWPNCTRRRWQRHCCSRVKACGQDAILNLLCLQEGLLRGLAVAATLHLTEWEMQQPLANIVGESLPFDPAMDSTDLSIFMIDSGIPREVCDILESSDSALMKTYGELMMIISMERLTARQLKLHS